MKKLTEFNHWPLPSGFQTRKLKGPPRRHIPEWAMDDTAMRNRILGPAVRRYVVAYYYWRLCWSAPDIASELNLPVGTIKQIIKRLR